MIAAIAWPLALVVVSVLAYLGFIRWLAREVTTVRELRAELKATQDDWQARFARYERGHDQLVTRINNMNPMPNPLGKFGTRTG